MEAVPVKQEPPPPLTGQAAAGGALAEAHELLRRVREYVRERGRHASVSARQQHRDRVAQQARRVELELRDLQPDDGAALVLRAALDAYVQHVVASRLADEVGTLRRPAERTAATRRLLTACYQPVPGTPVVGAAW